MNIRINELKITKGSILNPSLQKGLPEKLWPQPNLVESRESDLTSSSQVYNLLSFTEAMN